MGGMPVGPTGKMPVLLDHFADCLGEIFRQRCFEIHPPFPPRMIETQFPRMEHLPREFSGAPSTINRITEDRIAKMLEMDANLMSSTTVQPAFKQARLSSRAHDFKIGLCHTSAFARDRHLLAMNAMTCNGRNDAS